MSEEKLAEILKKGAADECVAFFQGMPEKERRSYGDSGYRRRQRASRSHSIEVGRQLSLCPAGNLLILLSKTALRKTHEAIVIADAGAAGSADS